MSEKRIIFNLLVDRMVRLIENHNNHPKGTTHDDVLEYQQHYRLYRKYSTEIYGKVDEEMPKTLKAKLKRRRRSKA